MNMTIFISCLDNLNDYQINSFLLGNRKKVLKFLFSDFNTSKDKLLILMPKFSKEEIINVLIDLTDDNDILIIYRWLVKNDIFRRRKIKLIFNNYSAICDEKEKKRILNYTELFFTIKKTKKYNVIQYHYGIDGHKGDKLKTEILQLIFDNKPLFLACENIFMADVILKMYNFNIEKAVKTNENVNIIINFELRINVLNFIKSIEHQNTNISKVFNNLKRVILDFLY